MDYLNDFLSNTALQYPILLTIFMVIGVLRSVFKPATALFEAFVRATSPKDADATIQKVETNKFYLAFVWFIDYTASIKLAKPAPLASVPPQVVSPAPVASDGNPKSA